MVWASSQKILADCSAESQKKKTHKKKQDHVQTRDGEFTKISERGQVVGGMELSFDKLLEIVIPVIREMIRYTLQHCKH